MTLEEVIGLKKIEINAFKEIVEDKRRMFGGFRSENVHDFSFRKQLAEMSGDKEENGQQSVEGERRGSRRQGLFERPSLINRMDLEAEHGNR